MGRTLRVLLLIPHLGGGGAEQVTALLAHSLSRRKYDIHLGLITESSADRRELPSAVTVHALGAARVRAAALPLLRLVRLIRPDVILSNMAHLNFLVLLLRPLFPREVSILVRQNSTVSATLASPGLPRYTRFLYRLLYPRADRIICQSRAMAEDLIRVARITPQRIAVLPNPLNPDRIRADANYPLQWTGPGPHLLAVGRLSPEKGFDLLLTALALVRTQFPNADLVLVGAGGQEPTLRAQARTLGLGSAVRFAGYVSRPAIFYPGASLFVLPSRHEGMPNALIEAAAAGLPLVALPCSGGVIDLLGDCAGAWLAPAISAEALGSALIAALTALRPGQRFSRSTEAI